ncbi:rhomboid family intramembrane serine protease, partial [PVC group bacterium]|nr:rhomboid family intramembrane serine protease [PVC group bacterium]
MFQKILIANRGEVALRIIRACKELSVKTVLVHSEADAYSLPVRLADEEICIGPAESRESYLNIPSIISAAEITDVEAIHPGYGFLAEDAHFAEICRSCNIEFIGPTPEVIFMMGDKSAAKKKMSEIGIPVIPGSPGRVSTKEEALEIAKEVGYPVIVKAVFGGGGRGMRVAHNDISLASAMMTAKSEAEKVFGNGDVYIEKFVESPRHIEVQILADQHGNFVHFGEAHLVANMFFLWVFGLVVEGKTGWWKYLLIYFGIGAYAFAISVVAANTSDNTGGIIVADAARVRSRQFRKLWCDAGFKKTFIKHCRTHHVAVEVVNRIHRHRFAVLPKRWIIERTWSWLMNNRRLQVDYERDLVVTEGFIWAAHSCYLLRRLTQP